MRTAVWVAVVAVLTGGSAFGQEKKPEILVKLEGHRGGVSALAFDPKVTLLATGSGNGVVRIWETRTGEFAFPLDSQRHNGARVNHIGFSASGTLVSTSSKNAVLITDITPPKKEADPLDPKEPKKGKLPTFSMGDAVPGTHHPLVFEDTLGTDPLKIGTVTGDGHRCYLSATEGIRVAINSHALSTHVGTDTSDELKGVFTPWAVSAINDAESELVAMYGFVKGAEKNDPAIALVGLGDARIIARGTVHAPVPGRHVSIGFAPDGKWLVACNGAELMYWRVPGSQVVAGDPKILANSPAFTAAAGPNGLIAYASPPEDGKTVKVTIADISGAQPKTVAVYSTSIERVSVLAFSPDGAVLAVADDVEGVVQLWALK
jgi:WD40 repeat protein